MEKKDEILILTVDDALLEVMGQSLNQYAQEFMGADIRKAQRKMKELKTKGEERMNKDQSLELTMDKDLTAVIYNALYAYWHHGGQEAREQVEDTDALEVFRIANMYFQSEEQGEARESESTSSM
ncbi:hypothetical protein [Faecalicoccus acidiformans]|uniref:Phage gp6-like head-tail connector protein n=1 Tax=Faecalicoccus acidiformans TaxID=915173 RepID=A0ABS2FNP2_9FIRM|nr:hypothetical protein [Faecalicoccus acidiformans]MBM6830995.1 hypothetical protein [Faecalicoccus acidiformans]